MMTDWYQKSINTLSLNGKGERTQEAYTRALRMLVEFRADKRPKDITEAELEAYFLRRKNVDHWSSNTMRICYCGIRFYFEQKGEQKGGRHAFSYCSRLGIEQLK